MSSLEAQPAALLQPSVPTIVWTVLKPSLLKMADAFSSSCMALTLMEFGRGSSCGQQTLKDEPVRLCICLG